MSVTGPAPPGAAGGTGGISDVVSQADLTTWAQLFGVLKYLAAPLDPPPPAAAGSSVSPGAGAATYANVYAVLAGAGAGPGLAHTTAARNAARDADVGGVAAWFETLVMMLLDFLFLLPIKLLGLIRKGVDPSVGGLAVDVLNEFLGTSLSASTMPLGLGTGDHIARAQTIGTLLLGQLEKEFAPKDLKVVPATAPAATFSGLAVNFGLASGIMGVLGACIPFGFHLEEMRELGEEVSRNIGLGRLVRRALTPLIQILVAQPLTWWLNTKYLPTQFREGDLVNPFTSTTMSVPQLYQAMNLLGYSNDKVQAFLEMHEKRIAPAEVALLVDNALWAQADADKYLARAGWPAGFQGTLFALEDLHEQRSWYDKLVAELEEEVKAGRLTLDEFEGVLRGTAVSTSIPGAGPGGTTLPTRQGLPFSDGVKDVIMATVRFKAAALARSRPARLGGGELFYAFAAGLVTASDLTARWTAQGLSQDDQDLRLQLWLLHLNRLHDLETLRQRIFQQRETYLTEKAAGLKPHIPVPPPPIPPFPLG